jgi:ribosome-associated toxin RatA of RatAB toxin-antitoxin module
VTYQPNLAPVVLLFSLALGGCATSRPVVLAGTTADPAALDRGAEPAVAAPVSPAAPPPSPPPSEAPLEVERELVIQAPIDLVYGILDDPQAYWKILPWVRNVKPLGRSPEGDLLLTLVHGMPLINADYTMRVRKGPDHSARMWIDREFPHSIAEAHGEAVFTEGPNQTTVVHFHMESDLGRGSLLWMFAPRIKSEMNKIPVLLRTHAESLAAHPAP